MMKKLALAALLFVMIMAGSASAQIPKMFYADVAYGSPVTVDFSVQDKYGNIRVPSLITVVCDNGMNTTLRLPGLDGMVPYVTGSGVRDIVFDGTTYTVTGNWSMANTIYLTNGVFSISPRCHSVIVTDVQAATTHKVWITAEYE